MTKLGDSEDSLSVEVSADGAKVDVKGRAASAVGDALLDLLSPFTNATGFIGDRLADARRNAAIASAAKAIKLLKSEGIVAGSVPPKILLPWLEGASLEQDETLQGMWAGLLARAVKSSDAVNVSYMDTLKKLGTKEAELLRFFATDTSPSYSRKFYGVDGLGMFDERNPLLKGLLGKLDGITSGQDMRERMETLALQGMGQVIYFSVEGQGYIATQFFEENEHVIANLEHLALIDIQSTVLSGPKRQYGLMWFEITKFAFDLFWACEGQVTGAKASKGKDGARRG